MITLKEKISLYREIIFNFPTFLMHNYKTCKKWDKELNNLLDNWTTIKLDAYSILINDVEVWVENFPYAYGYNNKIKESNRVLPKNITKIRLKRLLKILNTSFNNNEDYVISKIVRKCNRNGANK